MRFESRTYWHPKDIEFPGEYEDASAIGENGIVAVADGVSSAIFSRQWAEILTQAVTECAPDLADGEAFQAWLVDARLGWTNSVDFTTMSFFQRAKLQQVGGAFSTLLWLEFFPPTECDGEGESDAISYRCCAVGDCCLFHIRDGQLLRNFPLESVQQFDEDPITICSVNRKRDHLVEFDMVDDTCYAGDLLILASDALAKWWYQQLADEEMIDWDGLWEMSSEDWSARVSSLRNLPAEQRMRVDDTTIILLRMGEAVTGDTDEVQPGQHAVIAPLSLQASEDSDNESAVMEEDAMADQATEMDEASVNAEDPVTDEDSIMDEDSEGVDDDPNRVELTSTEETLEHQSDEVFSVGTSAEDAGPENAGLQEAGDEVPCSAELTHDQEVFVEDSGEVIDPEGHGSRSGEEAHSENEAASVGQDGFETETYAEPPDSIDLDEDGANVQMQSDEEIDESTPHSSTD